MNGEIKYADKAPSKERMDRFKRLAALELDLEKVSEDQIKELFDIVRRIAVLDESLRWPNLYLPSERGAEYKFETLMRKVQQLAATIQTEQEEKVN